MGCVLMTFQPTMLYSFERDETMKNVDEILILRNAGVICFKEPILNAGETERIKINLV
jgi:hypothetical protein